MAAPWEDVRDILLRVGFGSPRPSSSSDEIIRVTRARPPADRDDDGQRQANASASASASATASRRRRRSARTDIATTSSPMAPLSDSGDASTPLLRGAGNNSRTPANHHRRKVRIGSTSTASKSSRAKNRARGVRPVHQSPSQLLLDLSPAVGDASGARQQDAAIVQGDGGGDETAAALFAEALSPIVPIPRRTSSMAALSDYGEQTNGSDVDLSEVHDMVDQIQRDLTEDLREISTSINNYDDNTNINTNIANDDKNEKDGGSTEKAEEGNEGGTNGLEASCVDDGSLADSSNDSSSAGADSAGNGIEAKTIITQQERKADLSAETLDAPTENEETGRSPPSSCHCMCDCHKMSSSHNDVVKAEQMETRATPRYKHPIPTRESADAPARALCETADEIQRRAEVAGVLSCMITDVEQAHCLAIDLRYRSEVTCLKNQLETAQKILSERRLVEESEQERRKALGDRLLVELMSLGARLADIDNNKIEMGEVTAENRRLSNQLALALDQIKTVEAERDDALAAALKDRTLAEIEEMKKSGKEEQKTTVDEDWVSLKKGSNEIHEPSEQVKIQTPSEKESDASVDGPPPPQRVKSTDFGVFVEGRHRDRDAEGKSEALVKEEPLSSLLMLPERALMALFSFLEAEEILSVAEVNMLMYSRVDALFGLGGDASNREEVAEGAENNRDQEQTQEGPHSTPTIVEMPLPASGPDEGAGRPIEQREAMPRIGLAGQAQEGAHLIGSAVGNAVSNLLWQRNLQRDQIAATSGSDSTLPARSQNERSEDDATRSHHAAALEAGSDATDAMRQQSSPPLLTAGIASKIASKLSPQELSVIINMRTKINQMEEELVKGKERQDDLMAELRGIEGVKDFLVSKLRDIERSKSAKIDDTERTAKQVASDQEVIGFLDNKVGELEIQCGQLAAERDQLKEELVEIRRDGKIRFLEDQLTLMRDEVADHGKQWKMEKRVLVKEVKENRQKLALLEAEKRGMQSELTRLKRELSSSTGNYIRSPKR